MSTLAVLLKESWGYVEDRADDLANNFYARIFLEDPSLRELFPVAMTDQRFRWVQSLISVMQMVDDPEALDDFLGKLGRAHRRFHVEPQHYGVVGVALLNSLREYAGERWTIEYDQAWRDAYDLIAIRMLTAAERAARTPAFWHAEVVDHERRTCDVAVFTVRPLMPYPHRAGQYVHLESPHHPRVWRTYSVANAPRSDGTLEFHVRAAADGWVSSALVRRTAVGDLLRLGPAMGTMTLDNDSRREVVLVAGGTGLAPVKALLDELSQTNTSRWVHLFVGSRDRDDLYDLPALNRLSARHPWLSVVPACSEDDGYVGERGQITEVLERFGPWAEHDFYVCGSPSMVRATLGTLSRLGVPAARIRYDSLSATLG
jgi:NAD(P)H-flavin reductase/hemoglobin-like flavoprotein